MSVVFALWHSSGAFWYLYYEGKHFKITTNVQNDPANAYIVETWLKGWSLTRGLPAPVHDSGGFRVNVGWPEQIKRYVFPDLTDGLFHLAETIFDPWVFLKVCAAAEKISTVLPPRWVIQPPGFMMTCLKGMPSSAIQLPKGYVLDISKDATIPIVRVLAKNGEEVAVGRAVFVDDFAIYDRILTNPEHRRRGFATIIMKNLEAIGNERNIRKGLLVATSEGKALYEKLGWQLYRPYTTVVIPGATTG